MVHIRNKVFFAFNLHDAGVDTNALARHAEAVAQAEAGDRRVGVCALWPDKR